MIKIPLKKKKAYEGLTLVEGTCIEQLTRKINKNNTSGVKGVSLGKDGFYYAYICLGKKMKSLGKYHTMNQAVSAREKAEEELFQPLIDKYGEEGKNGHW